MNTKNFIAAVFLVLTAPSFAGARQLDFDGANPAAKAAMADLAREAGALVAQAPAPEAAAAQENGLDGVDPRRYMQDDYYRNVQNLERARRDARLGRAASRGTGQLRIVNLGEDFRAFLAEAENAGPEVQLAAWLKLEAKFPAGMANSIFRTDDQGLEAARRKFLPWYMTKLPSYKDGMLKLFEAGPARIEAAFANFKTVFPDYSPDITVYLLPSFFTFNACAWPGNIAFGPDMMLALGETEKSFSLTTAHEAFHTYSFSKIPGEAKTMATPLWLEGSATYASGLLTAGATESEALLDPVMAGRCADPAFVKDLAARYRPLLAKPRDGEEAAAIRAAWFQYYKSTPENPSRAGYCLGLQVFKRLAASHDLSTMMTWPEPEFSKIIDSTLAQITAE